MDLNIIKILCALFVTEVQRAEKNKDSVSEDTDVAKSDVPVFLNAESGKIKVGMFYYAEDESFSEELIPNKNVSGVVGYVDESGEHGLIVLLHQLELQWLNQRLSVGLSDVLSGKENTLIILEFAGKQGLMAEAVEYCTEYSYDGVEIGEAFLPSIDELKRLYENKQLINDKLALTKGVDLFNNKYYWSSSENSYNYAWRLCFGNGRVDYDDKVGIAYVCPVVAF